MIIFLTPPGDGVTPSARSRSIKSISATVRHLGRCVLFIDKNEVMVGFKTIGKPYLDDPNLGQALIPGMVPTPFHLGLSCALPQAAALQALLNREMDQMEESGQLQALWEKAAKIKNQRPAY